MKENKKIKKQLNTEIVAQTPLTQITDNRREITELTDAEIKEIEKELEQYDKCMWRHFGAASKIQIYRWENPEGCAVYRVLRLHPSEFPQS